MSDPGEGRPRVLCVGPGVPGGMITVMRGLMASPLAERYRMEVVATHEGTRMTQRIGVFAMALARIGWWSLRGRGRIVHIHSTVRGSMYRKAICVVLARALRRRVVFHVHSGPGDVASFRAGMGARRAAALRIALGMADSVLSVSSASRDQLQRAFGVERIEVIPNAAPPLGEPLGRSRHAEPLALFLGGFLNPVKGGAEIVATLRLLEPGRPPFVLAGEGELPPEAREYLECRQGTEWRGWMEGEEREEVLSAATIYILSSTSEGLPMALLEAMSRGQAIVATEVGGVPDVVDDGAEALLVPPGDPEALAAAVERLVADPELAERLGAAARRRAAGMGMETVASRIDEIYRALLAR